MSEIVTLRVDDMDETGRTKRVLSKVLSQPPEGIGLTPPPSVSASNNVSREDVRKLVNEQKSIMDSNVRMQIRARKCSLIAATVIVVFILGLMIGIVVYKDRRIRKLESQNNQAISKIEKKLDELNKTRITTIERDGVSLREKLRNLNQTIDAKLNVLRGDLEIKIKEGCPPASPTPLSPPDEG